VSGGDDPIAREVERAIAAGEMPGAAWWVGDLERAAAAGIAGHASLVPEPQPVRDDTPFDLASLTKPLATALLAMILDADGTLDLDTTLGSIFPELRSGPYAGASLRDAALHRAGFPAWAPLYLEASSEDGYVAAIARTPASAGGGDALYSDLGYLLFGFAVARSAGRTLETLFEERLARPLGLTRCGFAGHGLRFADAAATEARRAYEQSLSGGPATAAVFTTPIGRGEAHDGNAWTLGGVAGHAGLFGTAPDVASIARAIADPPRLGLPPGAFEAMLRAPAGARGGRTIGFLRAAESETVRGVLPDDAVGHFGFTGTSVWIDGARPRIYVLLTNRVHPAVPAHPFTATRRAFHQRAAGRP
jgi:CubicO group peptidase (beta-lactamase class C family)